MLGSENSPLAVRGGGSKACQDGYEEKVTFRHVLRS
jgi:hypothetical protein